MSSSSSTAASSPASVDVCRVPGRNITEYFTRTIGDKRACQHCSSTFSIKSSGDTLKNHMHGNHKTFAVEMGISLPSFSKSKAVASQPSLSLSGSSVRTSATDVVEIDDDSPPPGPVHSSSSMYWSSVHSSSSPSSSYRPLINSQSLTHSLLYGMMSWPAFVTSGIPTSISMLSSCVHSSASVTRMEVSPGPR
jgi:hypothetical protein